VLLERVFLRLGSAETDEQLEASLAKFLAPVLLKLASQTDGVRKKVTLYYVAGINKIDDRFLTSLQPVDISYQIQFLTVQ